MTVDGELMTVPTEAEDVVLQCRGAFADELVLARAQIGHRGAREVGRLVAQVVAQRPR